MKKLNEKIICSVPVWRMQSVAIELLERELTKKELNQVAKLVNFDEAIRKEISWVVAFNDLRKRNIGAQKEKVHFVVYEKNCFNFEPNYRKKFYARTEKDARAYVSQFGSYGNPFKITKEKAGAKETILETKSNLSDIADF